MPVYPGDPAVEIVRALSVESDGVEVSRVSLGSHTGTHVDAPSHVVPGGRTIDLLGFDELWGPAVVVGLEDLAAGEAITASRLAPLVSGLSAPRRVLLCTRAEPCQVPAPEGEERTFHPTPHRPFLTADAARLLWDAGTRLLGIDTPTPDPTHQGPGELPVHQLFLGQDGIIVENLRGLAGFRPAAAGGATAGTSLHGDWTADVELGVFPLPLAGLDGAPARVVARPRGHGAVASA
jgi:kynurenine formamidase